MRTYIESYEALVNQFERIHLFLRRLDHCTFTPEGTELLAKIMAQILSILALLTKITKEKRISWSFHSIRYTLLADDGIEKLTKKVLGKAEAEDALQRLDLLTNEENLTMMMARNLEDTHHFDDDVTIFEENLQDVHDDVRATQKVFCDVGSDVKETNLDVIKRDPRSVSGNVKTTKPGMPHPINFFIYVLIFSRRVL